ncbi:MAG: DnaD domain protein [Clostridium sp.]
MKCGWIRIHRNILKCGIWINSQPSVKVVLITLLLLAVHKGDDLKSSPGEVFIDRDLLLDRCGKDFSFEVLISSLTFLQDEGFLCFDYDEMKFLIKISNFKSYQECDGEGWVRFYRRLLDDCLWVSSNSKQKVLIVIFYLRANYRVNEWFWGNGKQRVEVGEFITSSKSLIDYGGIGFTRQVVRCAIKKFEKYGFISYKTDKHSHKIRINGIDSEETIKEPVKNHVSSGVEPLRNQGGTTNNNDNNEIYNIYLSLGFGQLYLNIRERIDNDVKTFSRELFIKALRLADRNNRRSLGYVEGILRNWKGKEEKKCEEYADDFDRLLGSGWYEA